MKTLKILLSTFVIAILFLCGCNKDEAKRNNVENKSQLGFVDSYELPTVDPQNIQEAKQLFYPMFEAFMTTQYEYLIGNTDVPYWEKYYDNKDDSDSLRVRLDNHLASIKKYGIEYISYSTKFVDVESITDFEYETYVDISDSVVIFRDVVELYSIPSSDGAKEGGGMLYDIVLTKTLSGWKIHSFVNTEDDISRWSEYPSGVEAVSVEQHSDSIRSGLSTYSRYSAQSYAYAYYNSPNTSVWCNYSNYSGGDCTNFVSQCLYAGGWTFLNDGSFCSSGSWYHNGAGYCSNNTIPKNYSCSWTQADDLYDFLYASNRVAPACYSASSLDIGDIVQEYNSGGTAIRHSTLVTVTGTVPKVTYRNRDPYPPKRDFPISSFTYSLVYWKLENSFGFLKLS